MTQNSQPITPVTVFTGSLGSGKTTVILNLVKQLPKDYKVMWLKNEYGDVSIDSELAKVSNIQTTEILNGCLCCVLIGRLGDALDEIAKKYKLDRLIVETAGTAYPYPIINEVNSKSQFKLDGLVNVIDALNYNFFNDKSILARTQAKYVDLVVINKTNLVEKEILENVLDGVYEMYSSNAKFQTKDGFVPKDLILGLDARLSKDFINEPQHQHHSDHVDEVETFSFEFEKSKSFKKDKIQKILSELPVSEFYRIKGIMKLGNDFYMVNYVLGKTTFQKLEGYNGTSKITFMGKGIASQMTNIKLLITN